MRRVIPVVFLFLLMHLNASAQAHKVVLLKGAFNQKPLLEFISEMEAVNDMKFFYVEEVVKDVKLNGFFKYKTPFEAGFTQLLKSTKLSFYTNSEGGIVLYEDQDKEIQAAVALFSLKGKVVDKATGEPIPFATVYIPAISGGNVTDEEGNYEIKHLLAGSYAVKFHFVGYRPLLKNIELPENKQLNVALEEAFLELNEVIVTPGTFEISTVEVSPLTLGKEEILHSPNFAKDIFRTLRVLPGVVSNDFSAKVRVRGGHSDELAVYLDHFPIKEPFHLEEADGTFSVFNTDYVEELKVLTGGFSAKYTGRLSGIMDVRSYDYIEHDQYNAFVDLLNLGVTVQKKLGPKANFFLAARKGYMDYLLDFDSPGGFSIENQTAVLKPRFHDIWSKLSFEANRKNQFSLNVLYAKDNFFYQEEDQFSNKYKLQNIRLNTNAWLNWKWFPAPNLSALTTVGYQKISKDARFKFAESIFDDNIDQNESDAALLTSRLYWKINDHHSFEAGVEGERFFSEYFYHEWRYDIFGSSQQNIKLDTISVDNRFNGFLLAGYIQDSWTIGKLIVQPGLRVSHQSFGDTVYWSPRLAVNYQIMESLNARLGYGIYYQADAYYKLRAAQGQLRPFKENARNIQYTGSINYSPKKIHLQANVHYKDYMNLFDDYRFEFFNRLPGVGLLDRPFNTTTGMSRGLEVMLRKPYAKNLFMVSYALAENKIFDKNGKFAYRDFDQRHSVVVENIFRLPFHWDFSLLWRYHTGHPYSPTEVAFVGRSDFSDRAIMFYTVGEKNSKRLPATHGLDLKIEKSWFFKKSKLTAYLNIVNLYNRENLRSYYWNLQQNKNSGKLRSFQDYQPNIPFFISPGISYTLR